MTGSEEFEASHHDRVACLHINYDGSRVLTGSIDHRIKVWSISPQTHERTLVDTWTAHDADIRDAKWLHPSTGTHLGTVGNDLKFHLWGEEPSQAPNSGRRFRKLYTINSPTKVPFVSIDFRNIDSVYTYLAVIDRQGLLSVYEPTNPDEFKDWTLVDRWNVAVPVPGRGDQTCFRVRWDQNVMPLPYVCGINDDRRQLSLIVTAGTEVHIYRGVVSAPDDRMVERDPSAGGDSEASHRIKFFEAARLPPHPSLVRDVQWAPFNIRGTDLFATACKDGGVRIFELSVTGPIDHHHHHRHQHQPQQPPPPVSRESRANSVSTGSGHPNQSTISVPSASPFVASRSQTPSGTKQAPPSSTLTSAIASRQNQTQSQSQQAPQPLTASPHLTDTSSSKSPTNATGGGGGNSTRYTQPRNTHRFPYHHSVTLIANLAQAHNDAWSVSWDPNGQVLISCGADGSTKIWRRSVLDTAGYGPGNGTGDGAGSSNTGGRWMLFADQTVTIRGDGDNSSTGDLDYGDDGHSDYGDFSDDDDDDENDNDDNERDDDEEDDRDDAIEYDNEANM